MRSILVVVIGDVISINICIIWMVYIIMMTVVLYKDIGNGITIIIFIIWRIYIVLMVVVLFGIG